MRPLFSFFLVACVLSRVLPAIAASHYVNAAGTNGVPPYDSWETAASTIQDAVNAAVNGDEIVVTNGVYATGGRSWDGVLLNRVAVTNALALRSVNGPAQTIIQGYQPSDATNGYAAARCVYLTNGAFLSGFTLTGGTTLSSGDVTNQMSGGGVWCSSLNVLVSNCVLTGNSCARNGGGAYSGTFDHCLLAGNSAAANGGGAYASAVSHSTLAGNSATAAGGGAFRGNVNNCRVLNNSAGNNGGGASLVALANCAVYGNSSRFGGGANQGNLTNCTISGNTATYGGGTYSANLFNSIIYSNTASSGTNNSWSTNTFCCSTDVATGTGNINADPKLISPWRLAASSPCRGAGSASYTTGLDIDDEAWAVPPSIGCDEYSVPRTIGDLSVNLVATNLVTRQRVPLSFWANISGASSSNVWEFSDGVTEYDKLQNAHSWANTGDYTVSLTVYNDDHPEGAKTTLDVHVLPGVTRYVSLTSVQPTPPYTTWATAATDIQSALDVATLGDEILVTNGVYATGGRAVATSLTNRVAATNGIVLRSVNGPAVTVIAGYQVPGATNGSSAVRCVYLANGAALIGFTLTNGATLSSTTDGRAGGVWCGSANTLVSNCIITGNASYDSGGGAYSGTLQNCVLSGNWAPYGGGACQSVLTNCTLASNVATISGGGTQDSLLNNCTLTGNSSVTNGGAACNGTLINCLLASNLAQAFGGGTYGSVLSNCTLSANSAATNGGGAFSGTLYNCTLSSNSATYCGGGSCSNSLYSCTLSGNSAGTNGGGAFGATLNNCTLTGNAATVDGFSYGGGAGYCTLSNCVLFGNSAYGGGGSCYGTLRNCALSRNQATRGGGAYGGALNNCTLVGNQAALYGGGASQASLFNCILYSNAARANPNYDSSSLFFCCATPLAAGTGNKVVDPLLCSLFHLSASSPCRGAGSAAYARGFDIDGEPWASPPSIGCDELVSGSVTGALSVAIQPDPIVGTNQLTAGFLANVSGRVTATVWDFGDGSFATNQAIVSHTWPQAGTYTVMLTAYNESYPEGVSTSMPLTLLLPNRHYVDAASGSPVPPYRTWETAATTIQDAVDVAEAGDEVLVTNGVYRSGGRAVFGSLTNRVAVTNAIVLRSVNGPDLTFIQGCWRPSTNQMESVARCVYLADGALLSGFTLTNGMTRISGDMVAEQSGAGVWCQGLSAVVSNCVLAGNSATAYGGGAHSGSLQNCILTRNQASWGGGANASSLTNCTLTGNWASSKGGGAYNATLQGCTLSQNEAYDGGGASQSSLWSCGLYSNIGDWTGGGASAGTLNNCTVVWNTSGNYGGGTYGAILTNSIVMNNLGASGSNYYGGLLSYCCAMPLAPGLGNLAVDPLLASLTHLSSSSPCRGKGRPGYTTGTDMDGEPWANPPSIGCDEYYPGAVVGPLSVAIQARYGGGSSGLALVLTANIVGAVSSSTWTFGDATSANNQPSVSHTWPQAGDYTVRLTAYNDSYPAGVSASLPLNLTTYKRHFVVPGNPSPVSPYLTWATAATSIQDAVDAASGSSGEEVWVTNGVYETGGRVVSGALTNRLAITKPVTVRAVNGPAVTMIKGYQDPVTTNGDSAVRCVYLGPGAGLVGFTITNGATRRAGDQILESCGGGIWTAATNAMVSNCVIIANSAFYEGGGAFSNTLVNCTLTGNSASFGGGVCAGTLTNCTLTGNTATTVGGGAAYGIVRNCLLASNSAANAGGGAYYGSLTNCTFSANTASIGGGAAYGVLGNCTLTGNTAASGGGTYGGSVANSALNGNAATDGGGAYGGTLYNCTLVANSASNSGGGANGATLYNSIVYYNNAPSGSNYIGSTLSYCCTTPVITGTLNFTTEPKLASLWHLSVGSPCKGAGYVFYAKGKDLDGDAWASPPSVGCDEYVTGTSTGSLTVAIQTNGAANSNSLALALTANISGKVTASRWSFGDGSTLTNCPSITHTWSQPGSYTVVLTAYNDSNPLGVSASLPVTVTSPSRLPSDWLQKYGLPADGSADDLDSDGDGMSNRQEWIADTDPTNPASALRMLRADVDATGTTVSWSSVSTRFYSLERASNLAIQPAFSLVQSNRPGVAGITTFTDTNATGPGPFFYRVRVEH